MSQTDLRPAPDVAPVPAHAAPGAPTVAVRPRGRVTLRLRPGPARALGALFLAGAVACTLLIVLDAAAAKSPLVPRQPTIARWLHGPGSMLDYKTFLFALLAMTACYAGAVWCSHAVPDRVAIGAIALLHLVVLVGPVLLSQDVFQYIDYGRMGTLHGLNPYTHGPAAVHGDGVFRYVGKVWHFTPTVYGPVFTLLSYPLALLGVDGALWGMKVLGVASSLATIGFVWLCARRLGRNPVPPALLIGVNPLLIIYGVGGSHNDLLMTALMMAGVWLVIRDQDGWGGAAIVASAAVKATSAIILPFILLGRRRLGLVSGSVIAVVVLTLVSYAIFGAHSLDVPSALKHQQSFVSSDSFPNEIAHLLGYPGVFPVDRLLLRVTSVIGVLWLMWRTWRGYEWISAAAWTLLLVAVTTTWLLPWYLLWGLPLAVLSRDRRVLWATAAVSALFIIHQTAPLFSPTT